MQNIRPSAELRNNYNEISDLCKETREQVFTTVNGHGDTVIMNYYLEQFPNIGKIPKYQPISKQGYCNLMCK